MATKPNISRRKHSRSSNHTKPSDINLKKNKISVVNTDEERSSGVLSHKSDSKTSFKSKVYAIIPDKAKPLARDAYRRFRWIPKNFATRMMWRANNKKCIDNIQKFEKSIHSQHGEDGIIQIIFEKVGTTNKYFVEFGVEDGGECNTRYLRRKGWNGLLMDCGENNPDFIKKEFITAENINSLFKKYHVPKEFDLLSIDIDSNDYWVWKAVKGYSPRVVVMEYNASIPPNQSKTIKYDPKHVPDGTTYFGASLLALVNIGREKGYTLVGCDSIGGNAFFVRDDLVKGRFAKKSVEELYMPPRYGSKKNGYGHPPSKRKMIDV